MKTFFAAFVALMLVFFLGCQNSITDPVLPDETNVAGMTEEDMWKDAASTWPGTIELTGTLFDQLHPSFDVQISGVVKYNIYIFDQQDYGYMKVNIYVNADLKSFCPNQNKHWKVFGMTEDILDTPTKILEKSFDVRNTCSCHYKLVLRFRVDTEKLILISTELKPYGGCYANRNQF